MAEYRIEQIDSRSPSVDVTKDRRAFAYDLDDVDEATRRITRDHGFDPGRDTVLLVQHDGYTERLPIT